MSGARWWIEAEGRLWGPYAEFRLTEFREQGRLGASTLVADGADGPFTPAALEPRLGALFADTSAPEPVEPATPGARALLVVAELDGPARAAFEAALGAHGECACIRPGLWLVRARSGAAALRNALSRRMRPQDALLVAEVRAEDIAWFNLDGETDRRLRRLLVG